MSTTITEKGKVDNTGPNVANAFSLQLNSQFFTGSPACSGAAKPAKCQAWQQFVYAFKGCSVSCIFMQYWLIGYDATCPTGWYTYSTDCYTNSSASEVSAIKAKQLGKTKLVASAKSGGNDTVSLAIGTGQAVLVSNADSEVDLADFWNTTEWDVFGDAGGGEALFNANTALETQTVLKATTKAAPTCVVEGFTAETNNLNLISTPALGKEPSPTMASEQTNATSGGASCAVKS